jgi:formiminotetrahydrofolate cyclodeaminase
MLDQSATIEEFLNAAAAKQPTPGGGSAAALTGALAASMGEMVLNYSVAKKGLENYRAEFTEALREVHNAREMMTQLMVEDQGAYEAMTVAKKLPAGTPERLEAIMLGVRVPMTIAATALAILELAEKVAGKVNASLLSDLAVCVELSMSAARSAIYNVRVNVSEVDAAEQKNIEETCATLLTQATESIKRVIPAIISRI